MSSLLVRVVEPAPASVTPGAAPGSFVVAVGQAPAVSVQPLPVAAQGPQGPAGPPGASVRRWYGEGPPGVVVGASPRDEYVDTLTGDLFVLA